ncbi:AmmeMemoRadiSam system protein B [Bifidobacterium amazonense]|uniref:AmmeMemoRadiSam system protein B n=1 Tax=Bifidobacterium amazonense TaxID=2809027 RepID=A0ABS9VWM4_9BIFI|nr:AmmeMemoRadiSam system protein B [Bifidobacterium amazonense]MCH9276472.1 AmmeMemoRadiSam system protein B [Bifidobacterium amazonense]
MMRLFHDDARDDAARTLPESTYIRPDAVAGSFYPSDPDELRDMIDRQLAYARTLLHDSGFAKRLPAGAPKAVIVPHAGYVYSGTTAALAYALLERGRGTIRRAVIIGPTHRVAVRGVACPTATAFRTPLGTVPVDRDAERRALATVPSLIVNDATHAREHAVEVQVPFLQRVLGDDLAIVPLNAGDANPAEVGDVIRALWGGPETVIVISSDLSHYHPESVARALDDETIAHIAPCGKPTIRPSRACGAYPINGLLDVCPDKGMQLRFLGCSTSGDDGEVALADAATGDRHADRPPMNDPDTPVVGYASFAAWEHDPQRSESAERSAHSATLTETSDRHTDGADEAGDTGDTDDGKASLPEHADAVLIHLARAALERYFDLAKPDDPTPADIVAEHPELKRLGASFVTLTEHGRLRGCIGTIEAYRPLGRDIAEHAIDAATHDPRFRPVTADEYPDLRVEVSVLSAPEPMRVPSRAALERMLEPGRDGLIIDDRYGHRATFLPQVWAELPDSHEFVGHLLRKAGLPAFYDWQDGSVSCQRYTVTAFGEASR